MRTNAWLVGEPGEPRPTEDRQGQNDATEDERTRIQVGLKTMPVKSEREFSLIATGSLKPVDHESFFYRPDEIRRIPILGRINAQLLFIAKKRVRETVPR